MNTNTQARWGAGALRNERGAIFPLVLIVIALAALVTVPVLSYVSDALHRARANGEALQDVYAADAGFEDALWRMYHDPPFIDAVLSRTPQSYVINVGGQDVPVEVSVYVPPELTTTPVPTPTLKPGHDPRMWTYLDPPIVDALEVPGPTVRANLYIQANGSGQAHVNHMVYLLPVGWRYVEGSLEAEGFYDNHGTPYPVDEMLPVRDICPGPPGGPDCSDPAPPFPWPWTGPNPNGVIQGAHCETTTSVQNADEERLEWSWTTQPPRVEPDTTARMSFDIQLESPPPPGLYFDDPWLWVNQQRCSSDGHDSDLQAGEPSWIMVGLRVNISATSEDGDTTTAGDVLVQDVSHILTYTSE